MVYESDFYTVRRPYSRPTITSYSVTAPRISVTTWRVKPSIRTSVLIGELDRIHHRSRPHLSYVPTEDFLNSRPLVDFDDETKVIRAETERLMKRIYTSVPHPRTTTPLQIVPYYGHRASDRYNSHRTYNSVSDDIYNMSHYNEPSARTIGRGHLACVSFAGGRGYPRRKHLYLDENRDIQDEIKFRSYYNKNRAYEEAMSLPTGFASYLLRLQPDNRNGTLTSSEKLHITNILKERKIKNSTDDNKKNNDAPEKKTSTVIPIERETKPYKYKSKETEPYENHTSEIKSTINSSNSHKIEEPQQKLSEEKLAPESNNPIVQPEERIIEINVEPKVRKESLKSSRKTSKTKIQAEEKEVKIQPKPQDEEKQVAANDMTEPEKLEEEKRGTQESNLLDIVEVVKQDTETDITDGVINESNNELNTEFIKDDSIKATESPVAEESPIVSESPVMADALIFKNDPITTDELIATETPITVESPIAQEEKTIDVEIKENISNNIEEALLENNQNIKTEEKEDILEQDLNKIATENDENVLEIDKKKDDNNFTSENEVSSEIQERVTDTTEETVFHTRQVIVSSTVHETTEVIVTSNQIEIENIQEEPTSEQAILGIDDNKRTDESVQVTQQTEEASNEEVSADLTNTKEIRSDDLLNRLNAEASTNSNTPREKIIEIEIDRPDDLEHIIEEVTDLRSHDGQKESDTEPLVEEPQSPESELIYDKNTTNNICEVLSDVVEEA